MILGICRKESIFVTRIKLTSLDCFNSFLNNKMMYKLLKYNKDFFNYRFLLRILKRNL